MESFILGGHWWHGGRPGYYPCTNVPNSYLFFLAVHSYLLIYGRYILKQTESRILPPLINIETHIFMGVPMLSPRNRRGITQKLRLQKIYQAAGESVGCRVKQTAEFEAALLVEKLNQVRNQVHDTEDYMKEICQTFPEYDYLLTIPGFGPYVSARVLASVADPFRFDSRKQIIKMAGYDLCANRSGKTSNKAVPVISKSGNNELRYALYQAAKVASSRVDIFRAYFAGMLRSREREKGIIAKMRVKLAAKMLVIAWTLMKQREPFDPAHLNIE